MDLNFNPVRRLLIVFIIPFIGMLCSCETIIEVDIPHEKPSITVNCFIAPDTLLVASVTESKEFLDSSLGSNQFHTIENAVVTITSGVDDVFDLRNGKKINFNGKIFENLYSNPNKPDAEKVYTLYVSAPGYDPVSATTSIPTPVSLTKVEFGGEQLKSNGNLYYLMWVYFQDPPETNFYAIEAYAHSKNGLVKMVIYDPAENSLNISSNFTGPEVLLTDLSFNGKEYKMGILLEKYYLTLSTLESIDIHLKTLTKEYYDYKNQEYLQELSVSDPFFDQPVQVSNNIENGFGIFAGYSRDVIKYFP